MFFAGLLVAYCSRFDVWINSRRKIYFVSCCIGTEEQKHEISYVTN